VNRATIDGNHVKQFHGSAVVASALQIVRNNQIRNSFCGIEVESSDTQITDNIVYGCRDSGIHINGSAGHTYIRGNHYQQAAVRELAGRDGEVDAARLIALKVIMVVGRAVAGGLVHAYMPIGVHVAFRFSPVSQCLAAATGLVSTPWL
jgi:parallel beta-helix repeat protein